MPGAEQGLGGSLQAAQQIAKLAGGAVPTVPPHPPTLGHRDGPPRQQRGKPSVLREAVS